MKFKYYIPHKSFFSLYPYGRVTHALGIANGLAQNEESVELISEEGIRSFTKRLDRRVKIRLLPAMRHLPHFSLLSDKFRLEECDVFLYRKTLFSLIWIIPFRWYFATRKFKVVSEINGFIFDYNAKYSSRLFLHSLSLFIHKLILRKDDLIYVVNEDLKRKLVSGWFPIPENKVVTVHNGGPDLRPVPYQAADHLHLVFFGILADYNELDLFVETVTGRDNTTLHIIGFGPESERLRKLSATVENVKIYGERTFTDFVELVWSMQGKITGIVPMKIGNSSASLSPIKAFDYMSLGMPLLYSNLCLQGIVNDGVEGVEYRVGDRQSLISAMASISEDQMYQTLKNNVIANYPAHTWKSRMSDLIEAIKCAG